MKKALVIGLTGSFGSGCSFVAENILQKANYKVLSLSQLLQAQYGQNNGTIPKKEKRRVLQNFGDNLRREKGLGELARQATEKIRLEIKAGVESKWIIDSIKNPGEVQELRRSFPRFFLFGIYADKEKRWSRVHERYEDDYGRFDQDDENDTGNRSEPHGQRVADCFYEADVVVHNNVYFEEIGNEAFAGFRGRIRQYLELVSQPLARKQPKPIEALMAVAYTVSQQSSCLKRKVGAIIVDEVGNIISSGFNEVPTHEKPCKEMYTKCYRERFRDELLRKLRLEPSVEVNNPVKLKDFLTEELKILDHCRAPHAEENAIVNLARYGRAVNLSACTLYTTTYPCSLCANKVVSLKLQRVVYVEPYPDQRAKKILKNAGVGDEFFEGVTFKSFSRVYGEEK